MTKAIEASRIPNPGSRSRPLRPPEYRLRVARKSKGRDKISTARSILHTVPVEIHPRVVVPCQCQIARRVRLQCLPVVSNARDVTTPGLDPQIIARVVV